jgi:hypothetical protein
MLWAPSARPEDRGRESEDGMHRSEERNLARCAECNAEIDPGRERGFGLGGGGALCFECAVRRGGVYDEVHDRWAEEPSLAGLRWEFD